MGNENSKNKTKRAIVEAAIVLFHSNGYDGTSIRDIAQKAKINPANIAYYFKNKNGLLEYCFINYLEQYTNIIEQEIIQLEYISADQCFKNIITKLLQFQGRHFNAARFITREMSLDTTLNREILSTYMAKERYYFQYVIEQGIKSKHFRKINIPIFILQLKGLLTAPVLHTHYATELLQIVPREAYFTENYKQQCIDFLTHHLLLPHIEVAL